MLAAMWVGVLGPTEVSHSGRAVTVQAAKHRALLAALALAGGRPTPAEDLVAAIWGPDAPRSALGTLQTYISVIRRTLEPDLPARAPSTYLTSTDHGYCIVADTDVAEFTATIRTTHGALTHLTNAAVPITDDHPTATKHIADLDRALALWRGTPFADLPDGDAVVPEQARLEELRLLALEDRATLHVACGRDAEAIHELEALTAEHPLRERLWTLLAVALARTGRQADALATLDRLRTALDEDLGLDPSSAVRELQTTILRQELPTVAAPAAAPRRIEPEEVRIRLPEWPLVGREAHLEVLDSLLAKVNAGEPRFVSLVGEPGAGKTRLGAELALRARADGALILLGRCSQEEDAPPLWPWTSALGPLLDAEESGPGDDRTDHDAARFAFAERIREVLAELATDRTVVLGLEDLHWADASSLRVLRHLASHVDRGRLLVVCTWRRSEQTEALSEAIEALARRHATRLDLTGLSADQTHELLAALTGDADPRLATTVHQRTDGNPFFLIEYGRLARDQDRDLRTVLTETPATVAQVIERRISQLAPATTAALRTAAVIGREFGLDLLAQALSQDELDILDLLEPAVDADLVQDLGADRFRFGHALVRDAAYAALSPSRRERLHATLAGLVEASPSAAGRAAEAARHWAAAGPRHVRRAWQAAADAGALAMEAHATDEATRHLGAALDLQARDPEGTQRERYDLLVAYADACRWSTRRLEMSQAADEATLIAGALGDPELVVAAATIPTLDALWPVRPYGEVNREVIAVMREALAILPAGSSAESRCRLQLALASELYFAGVNDEVDALVAAARAAGRASGDTGLLATTLYGGTVARWRRGTAEQRLPVLEEAVALATDLDDVRLRTNARFLLANVRCELGRIDGLEEELADLVEISRAERMYFAELTTLTMVHSWDAMRGDDAALTANWTRLVELDAAISMAHKADALQGAAMYRPLWNPDVEAPLEAIHGFLATSAIPLGPVAVVLLLRSGRRTLAEEIWDPTTYDLTMDDWFTPIYWATGAEAALELGSPRIGAALYDRMSPYAGSCVVSGSNPAIGPYHAYLALAAAAAGETAIATTHADAALEQIREWRIPAVERWLLGLRDRHSF